MRRLYETGKKGSRGLAMLLSALLIFSMIFTGSVMQVHAEPGDPQQGPSTCQLSVSGYDSSKGTVSFSADNSSWMLVPNGSGVSNVTACAVKFEPAENHHVSEFMLDEGEGAFSVSDFSSGVFPLDTSKASISISGIVFSAEEQGSGGNNNPPQNGYAIQASSYTDTNGKIQYSNDNGSTWTDVPAGGLNTQTPATHVRAVPASGYSVSYDVESTTYTDTDSHALTGNVNVQWIQRISFTSINKSLTVASYDATGGTIKYSTNGTDWSDVPAAGATAVSARYVKAVPASGHVVDSYRLNSSTITSGEQQTLTADNNTISNISFAVSACGGKYQLSITDRASGACTVTVTFLNSSGGSLGTASAGSSTAIPDGTAKIRISLSNKALLQSIQIFRNVAPAEPGSGGSTEIARPAIEEGLWANGTAEFSASDAYSYKFVIELSNTKNIGWSYRSQDRGTDMYVEHCRLYLLDSNGERRALRDEVAGVETTDFASYNLTIDQTYRFELVPDYGYQVAGLSINGYTVAPTNDMGIFSFTMSNTNFHFAGVVTPANDIVEAPAAYSGATI